jgi:hypothetical protein
VAAAVVPHARGDHAIGTRHAFHLAQTRNGVGHEVDDELRQRSVEDVVRKRQILGRRAMHLDVRVSLAQRVHERLRGVDGCDGVRPQPLDELGRQRARPAADVEHTLTRVHARQVEERRRERHRVPAHEAVVGVRGDGEGHGGNLAVQAPDSALLGV